MTAVPPPAGRSEPLRPVQPVAFRPTVPTSARLRLDTAIGAELAYRLVFALTAKTNEQPGAAR